MLNDTAARDTKILQWIESANKLSDAKAVELTLRNEVISINFKDHKESGTENVELGNGYKLKAVFKVNYSLNNTYDAVDKALSKLEKAGTEGAFITERLVKWKPELSIYEYNKLDTKFKKIIDEVIKTSPGTPSLELVEPKSKQLKNQLAHTRQDGTNKGF